MSYEILPQVIFDRALFGIRRQGGPARLPGGACQLRCEAGACAVGQSIGDQEYDYIYDEKQMTPGTLRGSHAEEVRFRDALVTSGLGKSMQLLNDLQQAHDTAAMQNERSFFEEYERRMQDIARLHHLKYTAP